MTEPEPETTSLARFQGLLRDLLQLELADLDFGIYRLLNARRREVESFLDQELPAHVAEAFSAMAAAERLSAAAEVERLAQRARDALGDAAFLPDGNPNPADADRPVMRDYIQAAVRLGAIAVTESQMAEVFDHLYGFFSRYYDAGDFMAHRRYGRREAYAVGYNGEETLFYWVNRDQHYVKTGEAFREYAFSLPGDVAQVHFILTTVTTARDNTKGDTRYFFPVTDRAVWDPDRHRLTVAFEYRLPTEAELASQPRGRLQEALLSAAIEPIAAVVTESTVRALLLSPAPDRPTDEVPLLLRRLYHFAKRNTTDYFVHRDLGGFLRGELDYYLKDQVVHLADLESGIEPRQRMLRVVRGLGERLIGFLADLEDAQRRLFEKRKLVLRTQYLVAMRCVPRSLWAQVVHSEHQLQAWSELYGIHPHDIGTEESAQIGFLESHPTLVVDTQYYDEAFRDDLLASFTNLDDWTDGLLIAGENYQALRLLDSTLAGRVKCIYIDPPYNTGDDGFIYKDRYRHSSWLAMMAERLRLGYRLLVPGGAMFVSIDEHEVDALRRLLDDLASTQNFVSQFIWQKKSGGGNNTTFYEGHEYILIYTADGTDRSGFSLSKVNKYYEDVQAALLAGRQPRNAIQIDGKWFLKNDDFLRVSFGRYGAGTERRLAYEDIEATKGQEKKAEIDQLIAQRRAMLVPGPAAKHFVAKLDPIDYRSLLYSIIQGIFSREGSEDLAAVLGQTVDSSLMNSLHPKPVGLVRLLIDALNDNSAMVVDFFAGSGTTAHATIQQNRADGGRRRFCLVEMGEYFDHLVVRRVARVMYSGEWNEGLPTRLPTSEEVDRSPRLVKVVRIESYEDSVHNVDVGRNTNGLFQEAAERSPSLLNMERLAAPFQYEVEVLTNDGPRRQYVDLIETFNLAFGLHVERIQAWINDVDGRGYRAVSGHKSGNRFLVLWRDMTDLNPAVEREFLEGRIEPGAYDEVLINGDAAVPGSQGRPAVRSLDPLFKRLIEDEDR